MTERTKKLKADSLVRAIVLQALPLWEDSMENLEQESLIEVSLKLPNVTIEERDLGASGKQLELFNDFIEALEKWLVDKYQEYLEANMLYDDDETYIVRWINTTSPFDKPGLVEWANSYIEDRIST